jgi:hypothetical protein
MRRQNPGKGLKLIGDATAEDTGAKYFLAMLKYRCNLEDPEAMALLQKISGDSSCRILTTLRGGTGLMTVTTTTFRCCRPKSPHLHFGSGM